SQLKTPDNATQNFTLDSAGQVTVSSDPLSRVTSFTYSYGSGKGDLTQIQHPDGSLETFQYDGTFHKLTQQQDTLNHYFTYTYSGTGDLLTIKNPLGQVTTATWSAG